MMRTFFTIIFILALTLNISANGVGIINTKDALYLTLRYSDVEVQVENQVAVIKTTQLFENLQGKDQKVKYAFPMPEDGSATQLRYRVEGQWYIANFSAIEPDTSLPSPDGEIDPDLEQYLGETPLFYNINETVRKDSTLLVELTYVQLLPYEFGIVTFTYLNDYSLIQNDLIFRMSLDFYLNSDRTVNNIELIDLEAQSVDINGRDAELHFATYETMPDFNYRIDYELSSAELGLFDMSTSIADSLVPDSYGTGFFTFIAEPDPEETIINKVFTLIVDRSGSMSGDKIKQARDAALFIVENLNEGDLFNIIDFSTEVEDFRRSHVAYTPENESAALGYITNFQATGGTNISGAFETAIPQFSVANDSTANIIIFFTDGMPTVGLTQPQDILDKVSTLVNQNETEVMIFTFGIGNDTNRQLLTLLATENNGLAEFLGNDELEERITNFYLTIRNPVLLNTQMSFSPEIVNETYPVDLPNLYIGRQLIISGRYTEAVPVTVSLAGEAFGKDVEYQYVMNLSDSTVEKNKFLTKIWAKLKIEELLIQYYSLDENDPMLENLREEIVDVSLSYGVLSPFTSFSGSDPTALEEEFYTSPQEKLPFAYELIGNYPNPFNPETTIAFEVHSNLHKIVTVKIYNNLGQIVRILYVNVNGRGHYQVLWDGLLSSGLPATSGQYFYMIDFGDGLLAGKMTLMR